MTPTLDTPRLVLRAFIPSDWVNAQAMLNDPETTRFMHFRTWTEAQRRAWFDSCVADANQPDVGSVQWAIARKEIGDAIGWFGIGAPREPTAAYDIRFGYLLARSSWNQGYMTEALRAVLAYEFETVGVPRLGATCDVSNTASARVMEKAGMCRVKTAYDADFEGSRGIRHHFSITSAEFRNLSR